MEMREGFERGTPAYYCDSGTLIKRINDDRILECAEEISDMVNMFALLKPRPSGFGDICHSLDSNAFTVLSAALVPPSGPALKYLISPVNSQVIIKTDEGERSTLFVSQLRLVSIKEVRGRYKRLMPRMLRMRYWFALMDSRPLDIILGSSRDLESCVLVDSGTRLTGEAGGFFPHRARTQIGYQEMVDYFWTVHFKIPGTYMWLAIPIDRRLALRLFKHREVGAARKRRSALKHLVSEHWRSIEQIEDDAEIQTFVREHIRGTESFAWFDLECRLIPSAYDLRRMKAAADARIAMVSSGTDHRLDGVGVDFALPSGQ